MSDVSNLTAVMQHSITNRFHEKYSVIPNLMKACFDVICLFIYRLVALGNISSLLATRTYLFV